MSQMVSPQIKTTLPKAPIISALWYPYDIFLLAGFVPIQMLNIEIRNPEKSLSRCAASVIIAILFANTPPTTSMPMNVMQSAETIMSFFIEAYAYSYF